jgi:HEAT repeat protein
MSFLKNVENKEYYDSDTTDERWYFIEVLGRMRKHPVFDILIKYLSDERVFCSAIVALGNLKDPKALPYLRQYLDHKYSHVRDYANKAISKIEKAQEKIKLKKKES